jgi:hypothetical protein
MSADYDPYRIGPGRGLPPGAHGPAGVVARIVGAVVAIGILVLSAFLGAIFLVSLVAATLIGTVALRIWIWWQTRRGGRHTSSWEDAGHGHRPTNQTRSTTWSRPGRRAGDGRPRTGGMVVDGEFEVVSDQPRPERD